MLTETEIQTLRNNPDSQNALQMQLNEYGSNLNVAAALKNPHSWLYKSLVTTIGYLKLLEEINQQKLQLQIASDRYYLAAPSGRGRPVYDDQYPLKDENKVKIPQKIIEDSLFKQLIEKLNKIDNQIKDVHEQIENSVKEYIQTTNNIANAEKQLSATTILLNKNNSVTHQEYLGNLQFLQPAHPHIINHDEIEKLQKDPNYILIFSAQNAGKLQALAQDLNTNLVQLRQNQMNLEAKLDRLIIVHQGLTSDRNQVLQEINSKFPQQGMQFNPRPSFNGAAKNSEKEEAKRSELLEWIKKCLLKREEKKAEEAKQNDVSRPTPRPGRTAKA